MHSAKLNRRDFLRMGAVTTASVVLAACGPQATPVPTEKPAPEATPVPEEEVVEPTAVPEEPEAEAVAPEPEELHLTLWGWWDIRMAKYEIATKAFTEQHPEVTIEVVTVPDSLVEKVYSAVAANTGPNMLKMGEFFFPMRQEGLLLEFPTDMFPHSWYQEAYPSVYWPAYEGYIVPESTDLCVMFYNKKMFEEAGLDPEAPPKTWDEYVDAAIACAQKDDSGLLNRAGFTSSDEYAGWDFAFQIGGKLVTEGDDPMASLNTSEWVTAMQWVQDMFYVHGVADVEMPNSGTAIGTGLCAMANAQTWWMGEFQGSYADVWPDIGVAAPPTPTGEADPLYGWKNSVLSLAALKGRPPEYAATLSFLEFFYKEGGRDAHRELAKLLGCVPTRADLQDDPDILAMPAMQDVLLGLVSLEYDNVNRPEDYYNYWNSDVIFRILNEQESVPGVLEDATATLQEMIDSGLADGIR